MTFAFFVIQAVHYKKAMLLFSVKKVLQNDAKHKTICGNAIAWLYAKYGTLWVMGF